MSKNRQKRPAARALPTTVNVPRAAELPKAERKPRRSAASQLAPDDQVIVRFNRLDLNGDWCLTKITRRDHEQLLGRLRSIEQMTVYSVFNSDGSIGKDYALEAMGLPNKRAQRRLTELELDDLDRISRLRIGQRQRLYGVREGEHFYALWWDPQHEIWP